jgi:pSer/pThr/pTyr-binding forkhead associated (FHA) protein
VQVADELGISLKTVISNARRVRIVTSRKTRKRPGSKVAGKNGTAILTITNGCFNGLKIPLRKKEISLGRAISCDICLDHSFVSEKHAIITKSGENFLLEDLNTRHGTNVNGKEIHRKTLRKGDTIGIGNFELRFSC